MTFRLAFTALVCSLCVTAMHVPPHMGTKEFKPLMRHELKTASSLGVDARGQPSVTAAGQGQKMNSLKVGALIDEDGKIVSEALQLAKEALDADLLAERGLQAADEQDAAGKLAEQYSKHAQHNHDCVWRSFENCKWYDAICHARNVVPLAKNAIILINKISHCPNLEQEIDDIKKQKAQLDAQATAHGTEVALLQALSQKKLTDALASAALESSITTHIADIAGRTGALALAKDLKKVEIKDSEELHKRTVDGLVENIASVSATLATVDSALAVLEGNGSASLLVLSEPSSGPPRFATTDPAELKRMIATAKAAIKADIATHNATVNSLASQLVENEQTIVNTAAQMDLLMKQHDAKTTVWDEAKVQNQELEAKVNHAAGVAAELQANLNQTKSDGATAVEYLDSLLNEKAELTKQKEDFDHAKIVAEQNHATDAPALLASHDLIIKTIEDRIAELNGLKTTDEAALKAIKDEHGVF